MKIRAGYQVSYDCPQPTPMILQMSVHPSRIRDVIGGHVIQAPAGRMTMTSDFLIEDSGGLDDVAPGAAQHTLDTLPVDTLIYLLGSRYCETDRLSEVAWSRFGKLPKGWPLVRAICDFTHSHIGFGYEYANATMTALDAYANRRGVCRDFAHLAIALCRCMNIPARYCTGYLGDMGTLPPYGPMDFAAWFEAYLDGRWYTFDPRNNDRRIGRILMARGRDATDVALMTSFGPCTLVDFRVITEEAPAGDAPAGDAPAAATAWSPRRSRLRTPASLQDRPLSLGKLH
jgi:transglutaminase-like putative cysteine protease